LAEPFEITLGLIVLIAAASNIQTIVTYPPGAPHVGLLSLPTPILYTWIGFMGLGGLLMIGGLLAGATRTRARAIERAGLWLSGSVWLVSCVVVFVLERSAWSTIAQGAAIVFGCVLRWLSLRKVERAVDKALAQEATRTATVDETEPEA